VKLCKDCINAIIIVTTIIIIIVIIVVYYMKKAGAVEVSTSKIVKTWKCNIKKEIDCF